MILRKCNGVVSCKMFYVSISRKIGRGRAEGSRMITLGLTDAVTKSHDVNVVREEITEIVLKKIRDDSTLFVKQVCDFSISHFYFQVTDLIQKRLTEMPYFE